MPENRRAASPAAWWVAFVPLPFVALVVGGQLSGTARGALLGLAVGAAFALAMAIGTRVAVERSRADGETLDRLDPLGGLARGGDGPTTPDDEDGHR